MPKGIPKNGVNRSWFKKRSKYCFKKGQCSSGVKGRHWRVKDTSKMGKGMLGKKHAEKTKEIQSYKRKINNPGKFKKGHHINLGKKQTKEHIEKVRISIEIWKNTKEYSEYINKRKELTRERNINYPNKRFSNIKIELRIQSELNKRGYVKDKDYFCNIGLNKIANVDIYFPIFKIIIECDGCLYHACKQCGFTKYYQEVPITDMRKTHLLEEVGYKVYRFWEHDIDKSPEECINKVFKKYAIST